MVTGRILQHLIVGSFQKGTIVEQTATSLWRVDLGNSRTGMLSTGLGEESLKEGQEVSIRLLNTGGERRLPAVRLLDEEESWLTEGQLQEQAPAMPCTTSRLSGRVLGTATLLRDDACEAWPRGEPPLRDLYLRSDPQRVGQRVSTEDVIVALDAAPCLGVLPGAFAGDLCAGDIIPDLEVVDIRGSGASTYAAVEPPRKD
ncbi:unnamed protein product, partial [Symbiodinium microadriaticum]